MELSENEIAIAAEILSRAKELYPADKKSFFDQTWKLQRLGFSEHSAPALSQQEQVNKYPFLDDVSTLKHIG